METRIQMEPSHSGLTKAVSPDPRQKEGKNIVLTAMSNPGARSQTPRSNPFPFTSPKNSQHPLIK